MSSATPTDPSLDALINLLLSQQESSSDEPLSQDSSEQSQNRRRAQRKAYYFLQLIAWYDGKRLPQQTDFHLIECRDVSPSGFSFFSDARPRQRRLIVALGPAPFTFFEATVARCEPAIGERMRGFIVGCRFEKRLATRADEFEV